MAGRAPAGFAPHPDAAFKLPVVADRTRLRDAVAAALTAPANLDRVALEAAVAKKLDLAPGALTPAEYVQALLDVCRDSADAHARLSDELRELDDVLDRAARLVRPGERDPRRDPDRDPPRPGEAGYGLDELVDAAEAHRPAVQAEVKRREAAVIAGCRLLGGYGPEAMSAHDWLAAQPEGKPWYADAMLNAARIGGK